MRNFVKKLGGISRESTAIAGGKATSLGEMIQRGFPVPPGIVLLTSAFKLFLQENDLSGQINNAFLNISDDIGSIEQCANLVQGWFNNAKIPLSIIEEINDSFDELGAERVAVRSSSIDEDGATTAWAGQFDSYLNTTKKDSLENIKKCWNSLYSPRAISYRLKKNPASIFNLSTAVVLQTMVDSEISGIAFSAHPVTHNLNQIVIEAGFGLGEGVVSGETATDSYILDKKSFAIIQARQDNHVLSNDQVSQLAQLVTSIERYWNFPCDVEWSFEKGGFYILQSRPITTLKI